MLPVGVAVAIVGMTVSSALSHDRSRCWSWRDSLRSIKLVLSPQPNRTYYLMDPSGNAHKWCKKIQEVWRHRYQSHPDAAVQ